MGSEPVSLVFSDYVSQMVVCFCGSVFHASGKTKMVDRKFKAWETEHRQCKEKPCEGTRTFWLSFCDSDRPEGQQFLGACVVDVTGDEAALMQLEVALRFQHAQEDAHWIAAASRKAHQLKCNPGGEMASLDVTDAPPDKLALYPRGKLMSKTDIATLDQVVSMIDGSPA